MADCTYTNFRFSNQAKENQKNKQFRWTDKMVSQLTECLPACKSRMEHQNKDFDAGRPVQYKEIRREMAKLHMMFLDQFVCHIELKTK